MENHITAPCNTPKVSVYMVSKRLSIYVRIYKDVLFHPFHTTVAMCLRKCEDIFMIVFTLTLKMIFKFSAKQL